MAVAPRILRHRFPFSRYAPFCPPLPVSTSPTRAQSARGNIRSRSSRRRRVTDPPISCRALPSSFQWCNTTHGGVCARPRQAARDAGSELTSPRPRMTWQRAPLDRRNDGARAEDGVLRLGLPALVFGAYPACRLTLVSRVYLILPCPSTRLVVGASRGYPSPLPLPTAAAAIPQSPIASPSALHSPRTALLRFGRHRGVCYYHRVVCVRRGLHTRGGVGA
jgi:hypothetical protein